uniref:Transient receptor potential cation channel subfamily A member 1 n=1 Tax=Scleropages formosus TaxID=113540 RepID=A0A8C9T394_SCLFO
MSIQLEIPTKAVLTASPASPQQTGTLRDPMPSTADLKRSYSYQYVKDDDDQDQTYNTVFEVGKTVQRDVGAEVRHSSVLRYLPELNAKDEQGDTPLHWAVERNQAETCEALLRMGADPNLLNAALLSPLHLAVNLRHNALISVLLSERKTDANLEGHLGNTAVMLACSIDNCEALSILFKHDAVMCRQNKLGHFAVHAAAFAGSKRAMEAILKRGDEKGHVVEEHINYLDKSFCSPLHLAVRGGNIDVIKLCISKGAKIDQQQCDKSTPLHLACTQGALEVVKVMLSAYDRAEDIINITDGALQTPLHRATIFDHVKLAEFLVLKGAHIDCTDCKGYSPLLLATSCGSWKTVTLLLSHCASLKITDNSGCNFLHLAVLQPKGLKNLSEEILQMEGVKALLSEEDHDGCTPLHYACRLGILDSVKNILGLNVSLGQKSKEKKSALHFAAEFGRINTCQRLLENMTDTKLLNEGDEKGLTPLHLASRGGHIKVVELLLRKGALFHSDYKGWTCLHHAAAEGYTHTMTILLNSNLKLLDKTDEEGSTALHMAAREGHTAAVRLLLKKGAKITLNKNDASFLHEAVYHGRKEATNAIIESNRCEEALTIFKRDSSRNCPVISMIEMLPESCKVRSHLKTMVRYNRIELLTHPVCKKYLEMKWNAYGIKAHMLNLAIYCLGLLPLSFLIVTMRPKVNMTTNGTSINKVFTSLDKTACIFLVLAMSVYNVGKEVMQIVQQRASYFRDLSNVLDWYAAVSSLLFVIPMLFNVEGVMYWQAGAWAILASWVNFLLYFQRFEHFGIYIVMFQEIFHTFISIIILFFFLLLAFAMGFYALMDGQKHFDRPDLSVMQTFVMMVGEINYQENFLRPYLNDSLPFPHEAYALFVWFVLMMPILLMNLLIGLAVGDIAEIQRNAALKRIAMQIELHTSLEEKMPRWYLRHVDQDSVTEFPNRNWFWSWGDQNAVRTRLSSPNPQLSPLEQEISKQKCRLKEMSQVLEKQHSLLKLIIQKMEISTEAEEPDGPQKFRENPVKQVVPKCSKWAPLLRAVTRRK